jgi:MYXO-CTERM domain-containing protein
VFADGGSTRTAALFESKDDGASWTEHPVPLDPAYESAVYIAAVDPINPDKLYLRSEGQSRLMVTSDGGATFTVSQPLMGNMLGFALSPDGKKVWLGSAEDGLLEVTDASTLAWTQKSMIRVFCLGAHGSDLWACSDEPSGFVGGVSQDDGATFTAKLHLDSIRGPLACPPGANDAGCNFAALCSNLGGCVGSDGGPPNDGGMSGDAGSKGPATAKSSCGCSVVGGGEAGALVALGVLGTATAFARRRRREMRR